MALTKFKLGDLIELVDERNSEGIKKFYGVNINKDFIPTVADTSNLNEKKYKVVRKNRFVFSGMQTGRDKCIRISLYQQDEPIIVSPAYFTFEISATDKILPEYFFMIFRSKEKDRLGWFLSDSSVRANLEWKTFCDIEIQLPPLEVQKKFVAVYNSMLANQKIYERGLDDLKLVCDGYIDKIKHMAKKFPLGEFICQRRERYFGEGLLPICGVTREGIIPAKKYSKATNQIFYKNDFIFNPARMELNSIALNQMYEKGLCSISYEVFFITQTEKLLPEYLNLFVKRNEFARWCDFISTGSVRESCHIEDISEIKIPIPDIKIQKSISEIHNIYQVRKKLAEELKLQLINICPILIKGSLDESKSR